VRLDHEPPEYLEVIVVQRIDGGGDTRDLAHDVPGAAKERLVVLVREYIEVAERNIAE
jgi:hypothetical protein